MNRILLYIAFFFSTWVWAQIEPVINSKEQKVAEPFTVAYEVTTKEKWNLPLLKKGDVIQPNLEIVSIKKDTLSEKTVLNVQLIAFDSGTYTIPSYTFKKGNQEITSFATDIHVSRVKVNTLQKPIYDIKPIKEVSFTFNDYFNKYRWILIGFLVSSLVGIVVFLLYWIFKNKAFSKKPEPEVPPGEEALLALSNLKKQEVWKDSTKEYYSKLTDVLRRYFERKLSIDALESTSDEILQEMKSELSDTEHHMLRDLLYESDLVKFAKSSPDEAKHLHYMEDSVKLVTVLEEKIVEKEEEEAVTDLIEVQEVYFDCIGHWVKQIPKGEFALWWKADEEDHFTDSTTQQVWDTFYNKELPFYPYILGVLLYEKGINSKKEEAFFPEIEQLFVFETETIGSYIIALSKEKGFTILMDTQTVTKEDRDAFLITFITQTKALIENEISLPKQREYKTKRYDNQAKDWYNFIRGMVIKSEKTEIGINRIASKKMGEI